MFPAIDLWISETEARLARGAVAKGVDKYVRRCTKYYLVSTAYVYMFVYLRDTLKHIYTNKVKGKSARLG